MDAPPDPVRKEAFIRERVGVGIQRRRHIIVEATALSRHRQAVPRSADLDEAVGNVEIGGHSESDPEMERLFGRDDTGGIGDQFGHGKIRGRGTAVGEGGRGAHEETED